LQAAIDAPKAKKLAITVRSIYEECGLRYVAIYCNPEALALFRANSTHLSTSKKRNKRRQHTDGAANSLPRDPLLNYKKPQLVARLRTAQQQLLEVQQQQEVLVEANVKREA
jgi:hypothetical protein